MTKQQPEIAKKMTTKMVLSLILCMINVRTPITIAQPLNMMPEIMEIRTTHIHVVMGTMLAKLMHTSVFLSL